MIVMIAGASHTGKTVLAQKLLERFHIPYLSIDHLKMGLIRSGQTGLTPMDDELLTEYLWPIIREMVKTAMENHQSMIVEGCYIPFGWEKEFPAEYLEEIRCLWLVMTQGHIRSCFAEIKAHASDVEKRMDDSGCTMEWLIEENAHVLQACQKHGCQYVLIDGAYQSAQREAMEWAGGWLQR